MKKTPLFLILLLVVCANGLDGSNIKTKLKSVINSQKASALSVKTKAGNANVVHKSIQKVTTQKVTTHTKVKALDPVIVRPTLNAATAAKLFNWFYDNPSMFPETIDFAESCIDLAFCMMNQVHWGSHVMDFVPQNAPTDLGDIEDELQEIAERVIAETNVYQSVKVTVALAYKSSVELCHDKESAPPSGICRSEEGCRTINGLPAMKSPAGDAARSTHLGCSNAEDCVPDDLCRTFGGSGICEHYTATPNQCRCMWVMEAVYAQRICGASVSELRKFDCAPDC